MGKTNNTKPLQKERAPAKNNQRPRAGNFARAEGKSRKRTRPKSPAGKRNARSYYEQPPQR